MMMLLLMVSLQNLNDRLEINRMKIRTLKQRLYNIRVIIASFLLFMPAILVVIDRNIRASISDYAYSKYPQYFVMLLTVAGMLFVYKYVIQGKFINLLLGISLIGVSLFPHGELSIIHYTAAGFFFIGSAFKFIKESKKEHLPSKVIFAIIILVGIGLSILKVITLFYGEWIAILPIVVDNVLKNREDHLLTKE